MKDGVIQQIGSPYEIYHEPANLFVAEFIGDPRINVFDGMLEQRNGSSVLKLQGIEVVLEQAIARDAGPVTCAIRPEHFNLHETALDNGLPAEVDVVQPTGSQTILSLSGNGTPITALIPRFVESWPNRKVWLEFVARNMMVFDPKTGKLITATVAARPRSNAA
jgi:ABC-type sugar transport system ATPase subunit